MQMPAGQHGPLQRVHIRPSSYYTKELQLLKYLFLIPSLRWVSKESQNKTQENLY